MGDRARLRLIAVLSFAGAFRLRPLRGVICSGPLFLPDQPRVARRQPAGAPRSRKPNATLSTEWQIQRETAVEQGLEPEVLIERPGDLILGIDDERVGGHLLSRLETPIDRASNEQLANASALLVGPASQAAHTKARHWIPWKPLSIHLGQLRDVDFGGTECVEAQDELRRSRVDQDIHRTDAPALVLLGETMDVFVQCRHAALERFAIMDRRIEGSLLKHVGPGAATGSAPPSALGWARRPNRAPA